jgi:S1-C subfamily serine protease
MRAVFTHITGIKRGQRETIDEPQISVGRAPSSVLAFAPADTRASAHHAEIAFDGTGYVLRDAGSTNGTYVNNRRVYSARLKPGDVIEFGTGGPRVQFDLESDGEISSPRVAPTQVLDASVAQPESEPPPSKEFGRTTVRLMIDHAVKKTSNRFRIMTATLALLVIALVATVLYLAVVSPQPSVVDFRGVAKKNQQAVVFVYVRFTLFDENGTPIEEDATAGSGFVVSPNGYIVTNRHVLQFWEYDPQWIRNRYRGQIHEEKVVFADHHQDEAMTAEIVKLSDDTETDLAILKIQPFPNMPVVTDFNEDLSSVVQGDPVAVIGYPLGTVLFKFTGAAGAETSLTTGVVSKVSAKKIQIDASANSGNSGGPIFDQEGRVIAVLTQGLAAVNAQNINFGTPISTALQMVPE